MAKIECALVYTDGRREVVTVGRPADLIAFADKYDKIAPSEPYAVRELAWLAHRALKVEAPLDEWIETLDDISSDDDAIAEVRAELERQDPTDEAGEHEPPAEEPTTNDRPAIERGIESLA